MLWVSCGWCLRLRVLYLMLAGYADCVALVSGCFVLIVLICDFILCFVC